MSNQIQIDLSKAYAGQIAHLKNGRTILIDKIVKTKYTDIQNSSKSDAYLINPSSSSILYFENGIEVVSEDGFDGFNIVSLSDPIQVQAARIVLFRL